MEDTCDTLSQLVQILKIVYEGGLASSERPSMSDLHDRMIFRVFGESLKIEALEAGLLEKHTEEVCRDEPKCIECIVRNYCAKYKNDEREKYHANLQGNPTFVDLFCGSGGMTLGFERAGFLPLFVLDYDEHAISTFKFNHPYMPEDRIICVDIRDFMKELESKSTLSAKILERKPSVVVGGPPCQGFSEANRQRLIDDPRNELYKYFVECISYLEPRIIVMENVRGISKIGYQIIEDFAAVGYSTRMIILNSLDLGNPQERIRVFFIGIRATDNLLMDYSLIDEIVRIIERNKVHPPMFVLKDAICGLRELQTREEKGKTYIENEKSGMTIDKPSNCDNEKYLRLINEGKTPSVVFNHKARYNNKRDIEIFRRLPQGGKSDHPSIQDIMPYKNRSHIFKDKFYRLIADQPCRTITSHMRLDCHMYVHPYQARGLTPREAARVQGFPDDYVFRGPFTSWFEQIGNAVPPVVSFQIASAIRNSKIGREL